MACWRFSRYPRRRRIRNPAQRLAAAARAYVRFASDQRPLFQALAGSGLDKSRHPEVERDAQAVGMAFLSPAARLVNGDERAAARLTSVIVATAHGHAMLMLDGTFGSGHHAARGRRRTGSGRNARPDRRPGIPDRPSRTDSSWRLGHRSIVSLQEPGGGWTCALL